MKTPKMSSVFLNESVNEAPIDYKKSFKKASKLIGKAASKAGGVPGVMKGLEVPKKPGKPQTPKPIRPGGPDSDPLKTAVSGEVFETEHGTYVQFKGMNGRNYALFVSADHKKAADLGEHPGRAPAIDAILAHHDKEAAGLGEEVETEEE